MSDFRFIARGSLINLVSMLARTICSPLMILLPRFFSQETFGIFIFLQSFVLATAQIVGLGFHRGMAWWIPRQPAESDAIPRAVWMGLMVVTACAMITVLAAAVLFWACPELLPRQFGHIPPLFFTVCMAALPAVVVLNYACGCFLGIRKPEFEALYAKFISVSLVPVIGLGLAYTKIPGGLSWSLFCANWLCAGVVLWHLHAQFPSGTTQCPIAVDRSLIGYSLPLAANNWLSDTIDRIDLWMVMMFLGPTQAAIYGIMLMLVHGISKVRISYDPLIVPVVSKMDSETLHRELPDVLSYTTHMVSVLQVGIAIAIVCFPGELLSIAGSSYSVDFLPLLILVAGSLVNGISGLAGQVVLGLGRSGLLLGINCGVFLTAAGLNWLLIPGHGLLGAASASLLVAVFRGLIFFVVQTRLAGRWLYMRYLIPDAAWLAMVISSIFFLHKPLASFSPAVRGVLFLVVMLVYGSWAWRDRKRWRHLHEEKGSKRLATAS